MTEMATLAPTTLLPYRVRVIDQGLEHETRIDFPLGAEEKEFSIGVDDEEACGWVLTLYAKGGKPPTGGKIERTADRETPESYRHYLTLCRGRLVPSKGGTRNRRGQNAPRCKQLLCFVEPILTEEGGDRRS